jgi:hypothetical protein
MNATAKSTASAVMLVNCDGNKAGCMHMYVGANDCTEVCGAHQQILTTVNMCFVMVDSRKQNERTGAERSLI